MNVPRSPSRPPPPRAPSCPPKAAVPAMSHETTVPIAPGTSPGMPVGVPESPEAQTAMSFFRTLAENGWSLPAHVAGWIGMDVKVLKIQTN